MTLDNISSFPDPPTLVTRPKSGDYPVVLRTRLDCEAQGNPTPTYTWYHNGKKVKEDPGHILVGSTEEYQIKEALKWLPFNTPFVVFFTSEK